MRKGSEASGVSPVEGQNLIAFRLKDHANGDSWEDIIVAFNSRMTPARLEVPVGKYTVDMQDGVIDVRWIRYADRTGSNYSRTVCIDYV